MNQIKFGVTVNTEKTSKQILSSLMQLMSQDEIIHFSISKPDCAFNSMQSKKEVEPSTLKPTVEETIVPSDTTLEWKERPSDKIRSATNLDWKDSSIIKDLYNLNCKDFTEKYDVSNPTFYYNRKKRKEEGVSLSVVESLQTQFKHSRSEFVKAVFQPAEFLEEFGYSESVLDLVQESAKVMLTGYYSNKYPDIFTYAGKFPDKTVGTRYGLSGTTVFNIRRMAGVSAYRK